MSFVEIFVMALALSLDACAVSLAASAAGQIANRRAAFRLAFHFGLFQGLMPVLGWVLGSTIEPIIAGFDHWAAFALLIFVAVRMLRSGIRPSPARQADDPTRGVVLIMLATATSIDALAVGMSLAILDVAVWFPSLVIGLVTLVVCLAAVRLGSRASARLGYRAALVGGAVLILIAVRIVITHTT
jgi:putative Mn2+ efflux pump MntP